MIKQDNITIDKFNQYQELVIDESFTLDYKLKVISIMTGISVDDLESIPLNKLRALGCKLSNLDIRYKDIKTEFIKDGITYRSGSTKDKIKMNVKETFKLKELYESDKDLSMTDIVAIMFREVKGNEISNDLSDEAIKNRKLVFNDMPLEYIISYLHL